jgi:hypothetical protein
MTNDTNVQSGRFTHGLGSLVIGHWDLVIWTSACFGKLAANCVASRKSDDQVAVTDYCEFNESSDQGMSDILAAMRTPCSSGLGPSVSQKGASMKRIKPCSVGLSVAGLSLMLAIMPATLSAQQTPGPNPLRTASRDHKADPKATVAVGTSVRSGNVQPAPTRNNVSRPAANQPAQGRRPPVRANRAVQSNRAVQPATYRHRVAQQEQFESAPYEESVMNSPVLQGTVTVPDHPGEMMGEDIGCADQMGGTFEDATFGGCCGGSGCSQCCMLPCPRISFDDLSVFAGVQGFTGPRNRGQTGSFGFHEGFNWGGDTPCMNNCLAMQFGARFAQSNLSAAEFTPESRNQVFLTGGFFRRVDWGLQGGLVIDYLQDDWYSEISLTQLRGEIGWVFPCAHELGFWMTSSLDEATATGRIFTTPTVSANVTQTWQATDLHAFYYRHQFQEWQGANGRVFAGFSGASDGFIGTDFQVPLTTDLALEAGFAYLVPKQAEGPVGAGNEQESWNLAISLVWYPGCGTAFGKSYTTPLFNVADNGSFMVDRVP